MNKTYKFFLKIISISIGFTGAFIVLEIFARILPAANIVGIEKPIKCNDINNVDPILYRPKHKFISSIKHKSKNISNIISMRYQSKQDYQDFLSDDREYEGSEIKFPIEQLDSLFLFNYIGTYELNNNHKVSLKISNLFDKQYELIQDFPMPGRTISLMYESTF